MKPNCFFKIIITTCLFSFFVLLGKAQPPTVKVFLPGHAPFISTPFYPMLGAGEKNKFGVLKYSKEKTDTLLEAVKDKKFDTVIMEFYKRSVNGKPVELYTTLTLMGVTVTTVNLDDFQLKPLQTADGLKYSIPFMIIFKSETHTNK
jgi:hypothetical protein